jgi:Cu/Ag efflux protein CusF
VTVRTSDGRTISGEVKDKKNLEGVKVGDKVSITFTEAVMIMVEPPKK